MQMFLKQITNIRLRSCCVTSRTQLNTENPVFFFNRCDSALINHTVPMLAYALGIPKPKIFSNAIEPK